MYTQKRRKTPKKHSNSLVPVQKKRTTENQQNGTQNIAYNTTNLATQEGLSDYALHVAYVKVIRYSYRAGYRFTKPS